MTDQQPGWGQQPGWAPPPAPKPGVIPLRPLGLSEILEGAISYIRANPKVTLGLSAVVVTLTQLVYVPGQYLYYSSLAPRLAQPDFSPGAPTTDVAGELGGGLALLLGIAVSLVAYTLLAGILIVVMSRAVLGWQTDLRQAWTAVQPRLLGLLGLTLLTWLLLSAVVFAAIVLIILAAVAGAQAWVIGVMALVAVPAVLCALIYLWVALAMAPPTYILEQVGVVEALRRSRRLANQTWWRVFGILLLVTVLFFMIIFIFSLVGTVIGGDFPAMGGAISADGAVVAPVNLTGLLITAVCASIAGTITTPVTIGVTCLLYVDQRIRKEAWNLELARAAYGGPPEAGPQLR